MDMKKVKFIYKAKIIKRYGGRYERNKIIK